MRNSKGQFVKTHGMHNTRFYNIFYCMKKRCEHCYDNYYQKRGIKCLWKSFIDFKRDMYESYLVHVNRFGERNTSIDRLDNNKDYCKENCRWATSVEQASNRRSNQFYFYNGDKKTLKEWAYFFGENYKNVWHRINVGKWSFNKALNIKL